jgi:hypothetical protein
MVSLVLKINSMLGRIAISVALVAAVAAAPIRMSARTCIVSDTPSQKACQPGCCANKTCCATSSKHTGPVSPPLAKSQSAPELNATGVATLGAIAPDYPSLDRQFSFSRAPSCAIASPQLAVLCTFLI